MALSCRSNFLNVIYEIKVLVIVSIQQFISMELFEHLLFNDIRPGVFRAHESPEVFPYPSFSSFVL